MAPEGHRPVRSTDPVEPTEEEIVEESAVTSPAERPVEPVVLPQYRPLTRRPPRAAAADEVLEIFVPGTVEDEPVRDVAAASFGEADLLEVVIGNDDRVRVDEPRMATNPWRLICALRIRSRSGMLYVGTAWFIGPRVLATAGHCVYLQKDHGWPQEIDVIPARSGANEPFGRVTATRFATVDGWIRDGSRDFDYGVILLDDGAIGTRVGNFEVEAAFDGELAGATARISGYPLDRDSARFQYYHERPIGSATSTRILYDIDTFGGQSGSPIWRQVEGRPPIAVGIHTTGGATGNSGTRISEAVLDNLIAWNEAP